MAGILSIYGMIICIINYTKIKDEKLCTPVLGYKIFGAGLVVGLSALASGLAIGYSGDYLVRAYAKTDAVFVVLVLVMIFGECIALYGFIVSILMTSGWMKISINNLFSYACYSFIFYFHLEFFIFF